MTTTISIGTPAVASTLRTASTTKHRCAPNTVPVEPMLGMTTLTTGSGLTAAACMGRCSSAPQPADDAPGPPEQRATRWRRKERRRDPRLGGGVGEVFEPGPQICDLVVARGQLSVQLVTLGGEPDFLVARRPPSQARGR
ncbi:MAG: hypothetical protein ABIR68_02035 [Ilumatobacteraceae bacterium]